MGREVYCYIGNWGKDTSSAGYMKDICSIGFTICRYDEASGKLTELKTAFPGISVGACFMDNENGVLYCPDEKNAMDGLRLGGGGKVWSFKVNPENGDLIEPSSQPTLAPLTSYAVKSPSGPYLIATNHGSRNFVTKAEKDAFGKYHVKVVYDDATVVLYAVNQDGSIGEMLDIYYLTGDGPLPVQFMAHPHSVQFAPDGSFFLVCDKGGDQIFTFRVDKDTNRIVPCMAEPFRAKAGSAPRYSVFHPTKPFVYTNNESRTFLYGFRYDSNGALHKICEVSGEVGKSIDEAKGSQSDLRISNDGKYLYSLVRGTNVISVYEIDQASGELLPLQALKMNADSPRGCCVSPDGRFLLVAATGSREVCTYAIGDDGRLSEEVSRLSQPTPCAIAFFAGA